MYIVKPIFSPILKYSTNIQQKMQPGKIEDIGTMLLDMLLAANRGAPFILFAADWIYWEEQR